MSNNIPGQGWATNTKNSSSVCLCKPSDLPPWHFQHRQLYSGYRKSPVSFYEATITLFQWHNESINVWLHIIGPILLFVFTRHITSDFQDIINIGTVIDHIFFFVSVISGCILPLLISATCHQYYFMNKKCHEFCWFLDFTGILLSMFTGAITFMYFSFYWKKYLMIICCTLVSIGCMATYHLCWNRYINRVRQDVLIPCDRFPEFSFYLSTCAAALLFAEVAVVILVEQEYIYHPSYRWIMIQTVMSPVISTIGIVIFARGGFPERFCKNFGLHEGFFDMLGHSHQIWHLLSALTMFNWVHILVDHYELRVGGKSSI